MTPGARLSAAIDCLDQIFSGASTEKTLTNWARRSRFAGSGDRAAIRDLVFDVIRMRESCFCVGGGTDGRAAVLGLCTLQDIDAPMLFGAGGHAPDPLSDDELARWKRRSEIIEKASKLWNLPQGAVDRLRLRHPDDAFAIARALMDRAPVDLRVNLRKTTRSSAQEMLASAGVKTEKLPQSRSGLRISSGARALRNSASYQNGYVELQDVGSQVLVDYLAQSVTDHSGLRVLDFCAGGGGKSLALAAKLQASITAHDIDPKRMTDLPARARRAGATITICETPELKTCAPFDLILCDAPCSGSGSWRRAPDAKWRFDEDMSSAMQAAQLDVLKDAALYLAPGGVLAYATCSLFADENEDLARRFAAENSQLTVKTELTLTPLSGSDGFFLAVFE